MSEQTITDSMLTWAVIGGGNGGQSLSGHLALMGFTVRLYDIFPQTIEAIHSAGGIQVDGAVNGFGKIELATTDIAQAVDGADIIMIVAPAIAHRDIALNCAPHLADGQIIFIHPGATGGALEFSQVLLDQQCDKSITLAEAESLLYTCRSQKPGHTTIFGIKNELMVAALPATETRRVVKLLNTAFPQMYAGANVLATSLGNANAMMHPAPTLLNTSLIESGNDWLYYWDGITPSIGAFVEALDVERLAVASAFGLKIPGILQWYQVHYGAEGATLSATVKQNQAYAEVQGQKTLYTRYLLEDIPTGLVPMAYLGQMAGVEVARMETVIKLGEFLTGQDLTTAGRNMENLGLAGMTIPQILEYIETGVRPID
ncbi:NAD/NADP octopine/nopaline dehydrogenase [Olavius sp. associated proteobacterium Delta 1]|nr:NAD/NADP octopine/nopaline dehydrogenase [Olavius sp. associated proteobacterium Delta 1]